MPNGNPKNVITKTGSHTFGNNKWYSQVGASSGWMLDDSDLSLSAFSTAVGDTTSTFEQHSFPDPTRSIETYMAILGETATIDAFIVKARAQDRYNWDTRFTAETTNAWIRAGFGMGQRRLFRNVRIGEVEP